jgi:hypothetical protein
MVEAIQVAMSRKSKRYWMSYKKRLRKATFLRMQAERDSRGGIINNLMPKTQI